MFRIKARVIYNKRVKQDYFHCILKAPQITRQALPGQFITIKFNDNEHAFLRRPFSIHKIKGTDLELLYEVVGSATQIFSKIKAGEYLDVIGPLGNGFSPVLRTPYSILVAGGMGVAPLLFLGEFLAKHATQYTVHCTQILIGAKTRSQILCEKEFKRLGFDVKIATDDGSRGFKGKVTDLLKDLLRTRYSVLGTIFACGPRPMLKEISCIALYDNIGAQISLEEHMACGIGACLGCVVKTKDGFHRVCKDGPVFEAKEIIW
jgi:dihydroorotate dehydrogenase electron transfer subunit